MPVQGSDRSATTTSAADAAQPKVQNEITISKDQKDTVPNMYAWGKPDNVYSKDGQGKDVKFILQSSDGIAVTKVAIFPNDNIDISNKNAKGFAEYNSGDAEWHQAYSGEYSFTTNQDGSATLTMSKLYRDGKLNGAQSYAANRCIYVYGKNKEGKEVLLYKTNIARAATIIPPKKTGSIVLKYDQKLEESEIQKKLKEALDAPTEAKDKKTSKPLSIREQMSAASQAFGVGVRDENTKKLDATPDDADKKVIINDQQAYDANQVNSINTVTSAQGAKVTTYQTGVTNLKTYLVSDLGYKSEALALTVARYDTRIDKPIVDDTNSISEDVKKEIAKKLANLNHVVQDKVTIGSDGTVTINFDGVDADKMPKIALKDLVVKKLKEDQITVPAKDTATVIYNPLGYSTAELERIKQSIVDANKDNKELGLTSTDQITLEYITGDTVTSGHGNQGISNGMQENKITVKIKTDKAYAEFTSDVTNGKLTRLVDIRKDYNVSWKSNKTKIDGRDSDEGISWGNDSHTTIIYRYDPTAAKELKTEDIVKLLNATPKKGADGKPLVAGLRDLTGGETLDHEGQGGKDRKSHAHYVLKDDEPTGELSLGNMSGAYWIGNQKVSHSDESLGDEQSSAGSYTWDQEAGSVTVAGKKDKIYKARLFVLPYELTHYKRMYLEPGRNPGNTAKAINVIFVPQTNHKTKDLKDSIGEHKTTTVEGKDVPTESTYYNASDKVKKDYEDALKLAKDLYSQVKDKKESDLTEKQKADIDNATINLEKARKALDGAATKKDGLNQSIDENGKPAEDQQAATGTQATNQFKNVSDPDFKDADGKTDETRNNAAKEAKKTYDEALKAAKAARDNDNATQAQVDEAKAKLDKARKKLNEFTTNKDELNAAIAADGKVNTGDTTKTDPAEKLKTADPTYQNSSEQERDAYDKAVKKANNLVQEPNASQKEVNAAIDALKKAKEALDKNATDKAPLDAAVQKSFDNPKPDDTSKQSVFYKNAKIKADSGDQAAKTAIDNYNNALKKAKEVLANDNATKKDVEEAKKALEDAEKALHADTYQTKATDLAQALADNFSGYLMPAYFNAFDKAQAEGKDSQAAKDFKAYNDAYHAAKDLMEKLKQPNSTVSQEEADAVKNKLIEARKVIDKYATDTSKISAALLHSLAIKASPAYKNASANTDQNSEEAKAKKAYDDALEQLQKAFNDEMSKDTDAQGAEISTDKVPNKDGDTNSASYLDGIQSHAKGQPLNRDVTKLLAKLNEAVKGLDKFATKTDELIKSINKDSDTHPSPAFKNAARPAFQKADGLGADDDKNTKAKQAYNKYSEALNKAKELLVKVGATQEEVNNAKKELDDARKELDKYNTDTTKLKESVEKHGTTEEVPAAKEGTLTSDAYRNASDPHFMKEEGGKLVPDADKNKQAAEDKKAYDEALTKAQELLKKHDSDDTPQDAKPTQKEINDALKTLDEARKKLEDNYKTDTTALEAEANKSTPEQAPVTENDFENTPEFKNADAKKGEGNKDNEDVKAYKDALAKARKLAQDNTSQKLSDHPTQKQIDDALDALKQAKQAITDGYKTDVEKLKQAKEYAANVFKNTPEYKNAIAIKNDNNNAKHEQAGKDLDGTDQKPGLSKLIDKISTKLQDTSKMTQTEVDALVKQLVTAQKKITENYKTNADKLKNEVGDKDQDGKPVVPPFEASVTYKNALAQADTEEDKNSDESATKKLQTYKDKLAAAQKLIDQVNNPDPNAKPEDRPTQAQVDQALTDLQNAKKDIDEKFKTKVEKLQNEVDDKDETGVARTPKFEESTEFANLKAKQEGDKKPDDLVAYEQALAKAKELIDKNDGKVTNAQGVEVAVPKDQLPTQQEVDEAQKALKEIKDKILANYKTNPHDLQEEFDLSKDGDDDTRDGLFENTPEFKNADAKKGEDGQDNPDMAAYKKALADAKVLLDKFDRTTGKPKNNLPAGEKAPTQKELDDALDALKAAKQKITDGYKTDPSKLKAEADKDADFTKTPEYLNAQAKGDDASKQALDAYKKALEDAHKVLGNKNATQAQVDEALQKLQDAKQKLMDGYKTDTSKLVADVDAAVDVDNKDYRNASREAQEAYDKALAAARAILKNPKATQAEIDAAQRALMLASDALMKSAHRPKLAPQQPARTNAPKHLAATSDPTNTFAVMGMITSAFGLIFAGAKRKRQRRQ